MTLCALGCDPRGCESCRLAQNLGFEKECDVGDKLNFPSQHAFHAFF